MLSDLFFINRNSSALGHSTPIGVFEESIDAVADIVDEIESNSDYFADASDTE